jgi:hypothetical protein
MSALPTEPASPNATPLPPLPINDPLTPSQWKTLLAIADACVPAIKPMSAANTKTEIAIPDTDYSAAISALRALIPKSDPDAEAMARDYLADNASSNPEFRSELHRLFAVYMPQSTRKELTMVLNILK